MGEVIAVGPGKTNDHRKLMLTTDAMVAELPEDDKGHGGGGGGGGMGGMGDKDM